MGEVPYWYRAWESATTAHVPPPLPQYAGQRRGQQRKSRKAETQTRKEENSTDGVFWLTTLPTLE